MIEIIVPASLLTVENIVFAWDLYNYYMYASTIYSGIYYTTKAYKLSKKTGKYLYSIFGNKSNSGHKMIPSDFFKNTKLKNDWEVYENGNLISLIDFELDVIEDNDWIYINHNKKKSIKLD